MTTNPLAKIFIRSPFEPITKHAEITKEAIEKLNTAFNLFFERDYPKMETFCKEVIDLETDADNIKTKIREKLPSGILMPVGRGDILDLIDHQDKIADQAENLAQWLLIKETDSIPLKMVEFMKIEFMKKIMDLNVKIAEAYLNAVKELKDVIETIFMKKEIDDVMRHIEIVENLEGEIDRIQFTLRNSFFDFKEIDPVSLYYTTKIIDIISDISDKAEASVHRLRILIAEK